MSNTKDTPVKPHLIKTQFLQHKQQWTAFVTWRGYDLQEYGETERNAVLFLLERHAKFLGLTFLNQINETLNAVCK